MGGLGKWKSSRSAQLKGIEPDAPQFANPRGFSFPSDAEPCALLVWLLVGLKLPCAHSWGHQGSPGYCH